MENGQITYIGKWIRWRRKALGLSQAAFLKAHPLCSRKTLSLLENGKSDIRLDLIEDLLLAFDVRLQPDQTVLSDRCWNMLADAYETYDVPTMEARITRIETTLRPFSRDLFCCDGFYPASFRLIKPLPCGAFWNRYGHEACRIWRWRCAMAPIFPLAFLLKRKRSCPKANFCPTASPMVTGCGKPTGGTCFPCTSTSSKARCLTRKIPSGQWIFGF